MRDTRTKLLAQEMRTMLTQPGVRENVRRVIQNLGAFKQKAQGQVVRSDARKATPAKRRAV